MAAMMRTSDGSRSPVVRCSFPGAGAGFWLDEKGHVPDFIQEHGAAVSLFELLTDGNRQ
jgi:hypothetical protein